MVAGLIPETRTGSAADKSLGRRARLRMYCFQAMNEIFLLASLGNQEEDC
jgi:hypothetical protein